MSAVVGAGTVLQLSISSVFTSQANITSLSGPNMSVHDIDSTILASPNLFKEFIAGFVDGGEVTVGARFLNTLMNTLYTNIRVMNSWKIIFSQGSVWAFSGYIKALNGGEVPLEDDITVPFTIKITGQPTFTP